MSSFHGDHDDTDDTDETFVVDPRELVPRRPTEPPARDPEIAKGTRRQIALQRDPIDVLKMWPVSSEARAVADAARQRATLRAPSPGPHLDDKIRLAHLALDLYRELEVDQPVVGAPVHRGPAGDCEDPGCQARTNALRGALVEACLLVQRIALMAPSAERDAVDDRLRTLLALIDR